MSAPTLFWFRRDLRLADNRALEAACRAGAGKVLCVFVIDPALAARSGRPRAGYLARTLDSLNRSLDGALHLAVGDPAVVLPALAQRCGVRDVFATADHAPTGIARDRRVERALASAGVTLSCIDSNYAVAPGRVLGASGEPCKVFSAFRRRWEPLSVEVPRGVSSSFEPVVIQSDVRSDALVTLSGSARPWVLDGLPNDIVGEDQACGEGAAHDALDSFVTAALSTYPERRNLPGVPGTSRLSAFLRFGVLHPRQVLAAVRPHTDDATFEAEIAWREFYADVLWHHPQTITQNLSGTLDSLTVDTGPTAVERFGFWARGETGYPLVDAGMRQLATEGYMHNRVRMLTASFLVKDLHLDWRWGAWWFMDRLIDGDIASNTHGWQWTAGVGTDAAPYHRIFNPTLQALRFDPEAVYIHRYISELRGVPAPGVLEPGAGLTQSLFEPHGYVEPMVDHKVERDEALRRLHERIQ